MNDGGNGVEELISKGEHCFETKARSRGGASAPHHAQALRFVGYLLGPRVLPESAEAAAELAGADRAATILVEGGEYLRRLGVRRRGWMKGRGGGGGGGRGRRWGERTWRKCSICSPVRCSAMMEGVC